MKRLVVLCAMLTIAGCAATAQNPDGGTATDWATVRCVAGPDGTIKNCTIVGESRPDRGFGDAALRLVEQGRLSRRTFEGRTADSAFTTTVRFREDGTTSAPD